ncbi:hypothetical protein [Rhodoblastus sp.]|uniref:hypothetical protein n=1 Tax=Rhodoblastus sp. TaxID=1962975 RepID=UPI003F98C7E3
MSDATKTSGLVPHPDEIKQALDVARKIEAEHMRALKADAARIPQLDADAAAMTTLRSRFNALAGRKSATDMTRHEIIGMLKDMADAVGTSVAIPIGESVSRQHDCEAFLIELAGMISDLDNGKTHPSLKFYPYGATASLTAKEAYERKVWVQTVKIVREFFGYETWKEAASHVADGPRRKKVRGKIVAIDPVKPHREKKMVRGKFIRSAA